LRRSPAWRRPLAVATSFAIASLATSARADGAGPERSLARLRIRFAEGQALESAARWADALPVFLDVNRERSTPEVAFHIALCLEHLGRLVAAKAVFRAAGDAARGHPSARVVANEADTHATALDARIPKLTLKLTGHGEGVSLFVDGSAVPASGVVRVDPGPHVALAVRGRNVVAAVAFAMTEQRNKAITLSVLIAQPRPSKPAPKDQVAGRSMPIPRATPSR
jgi:hypothetical protein